MKINLSHIKNGKSGDWEISDYDVPDDFWFRISMMKTWRGVPPGTYKKLTRGKDIIMSNTPDEISDCIHFIDMAAGNILINGLGLGIVVTAILKKKSVKSVIVIEKSEDVIRLIANCFTDKRLTIINADAFEYKPNGQMFDYVWHDIWDNICEDNLPEMKRLHLKYAKKAKWQDSWCKNECKRNRFSRY